MIDPEFESIVDGIERYLRRNPDIYALVREANRLDYRGVFVDSKLFYRTCGLVYEGMDAANWIRREISIRYFSEAVNFAHQRIRDSQGTEQSE